MDEKEKQREYQRKWREANPDYQKKWKEANPDYHKYYQSEHRKLEPNKKKRRELSSERQQRLKRYVIGHYSNGTNSCAFCSFDDMRALSIDHINGGGLKHIRSVHNLYNWLIKNNYPLGFRVLCMNCQWIKRSEKKETRK